MDFKTNLETKLEDRLNVLKEKTSKIPNSGSEQKLTFE